VAMGHATQKTSTERRLKMQISHAKNAEGSLRGMIEKTSFKEVKCWTLINFMTGNTFLVMTTQWRTIFLFLSFPFPLWDKGTSSWDR